MDKVILLWIAVSFLALCRAAYASQQETHAGPDGYCTTCGGACKVIQRTVQETKDDV